MERIYKQKMEASNINQIILWNRKKDVQTKLQEGKTIIGQPHLTRFQEILKMYVKQVSTKRIITYGSEVWTSILNKGMKERFNVTEMMVQRSCCMYTIMSKVKNDNVTDIMKMDTTSTVTDRKETVVLVQAQGQENADNRCNWQKLHMKMGMPIDGI